MASFVKAAKASELKSGDARVVEINGKACALFNVEGKFYSIDNTCVHRGGPLGEGFLDGDVVTCPWHAWQYDVTTGACRTNPGLAVACHEVKVEGDDVLIAV
ncbi:MAG: Rieske 2Fe-2S domain-containing protein [Acidobacteria bacterium]|nr:Rieske 2Fe-2S domain-containing protein [Acidobacteriota bacterium]